MGFFPSGPFRLGRGRGWSRCEGNLSTPRRRRVASRHGCLRVGKLELANRSSSRLSAARNSCFQLCYRGCRVLRAMAGSTADRALWLSGAESKAHRVVLQRGLLARLCSVRTRGWVRCCVNHNQRDPFGDRLRAERA